MKLKCVITLVVWAVSSISTQAYNHGSHVEQEKNEESKAHHPIRTMRGEKEPPVDNSREEGEEALRNILQEKRTHDRKLKKIKRKRKKKTKKSNKPIPPFESKSSKKGKSKKTDMPSRSPSPSISSVPSSQPSNQPSNVPSFQPSSLVVNDYTIAGSTDPVVGPSILNDYCTKTLGLDPLTDQLAFGACLSTRLAGPVIISDFGSVPDPTRFWYFNKDVPFDPTANCLTASPPCTESASFVFEGDEVCAVISEDNLESKTKFELWDAQYLGMPLGEFVEFSVDYELVSRATAATTGSSRNDGFVNVYLRRNAVDSPAPFYDCRLNYIIQSPVAGDTGTITITPSTVADSSAVWAGSPAGAGCPTGTQSIEQYLAENSNAVLGVGNGELYAFTMDTGSTNQNDNGLKTCWSNVSITINDGSDNRAFQVDNFVFAELPE